MIFVHLFSFLEISIKKPFCAIIDLLENLTQRAYLWRLF
nr:MAG TPA: hypothetical protein [Caudoviricetes sp.]